MKDGLVIRAKLKAYTEGEMVEKKRKKRRQRNGELKNVMKSFEG